MAKKIAGRISPALDEAIDALLAAVPEMEKLDDKLAVIDRALKREALKAKIDDGQDGSAFDFGKTGEGDD